ncbi:MAG: mechanosensitive ion channel family protein [Syntrophomonadales bacterium]
MKEILDVFIPTNNYIPLSIETLLPWLTDIGIALVIFLVIYLFRKFFVQKIINLLLKITDKTHIGLDNLLIMAYEKPLQLFFAALGIYLALAYLPLSVETNVLISRLYRSIVIILVSFGLWNLVGLVCESTEETGNLAIFKIDKILLPFLSRVLKFIIVVLALSIILQEWDYDINGLIAGLGLGGLAFALAAQQTLANLFGGFVILTDKPFSLGDWILTPSVEGVVEDINFRSTKIRTFAQAVVSIPNSTLASEPITNWSRMDKRRITFMLGVNYSTPREKIEKCVTDIREMLRSHPDIHQETIFVNFDSYGESSLNIFLWFFTKTTVWEEFLQVKEDVNLKIMSILEDEGVTVALPSTSIYFENDLTTRAINNSNPERN